MSMLPIVFGSLFLAGVGYIALFPSFSVVAGSVLLAWGCIRLISTCGAYFYDKKKHQDDIKNSTFNKNSDGLEKAPEKSWSMMDKVMVFMGVTEAVISIGMLPFLPSDLLGCAVRLITIPINKIGILGELRYFLFKNEEQYRESQYIEYEKQRSMTDGTEMRDLSVILRNREREGVDVVENQQKETAPTSEVYRAASSKPIDSNLTLQVQ